MSKKILRNQNLKRYLPYLIFILLAFLAVPAAAEEVSVSVTVKEINEYGNAVLDMSCDDFAKAGFMLGDVVEVTSGDYREDMPYLNGYYVERGEPVILDYPDDPNIIVCIKYGNFSEISGIMEGDPVTVFLKEPSGALALQETNNLVYTDDRADSESDEVFANFRPVVEGKLYRSASPIDNKRNRAGYADKLIKNAGVQTVMNMADTAEEIEAFFLDQEFSSPFYKVLYEAGKVIPLGMGMDYTSEEFALGLVKGFSFLAEHDTPYLIHCLEGKDRTGFAAMVLEALIGWDEKQIVADYMLTYTNYFGIAPGTEKYDMIVEKNVKEMICFMTGTKNDQPLKGAELKAAAEKYLKNNGMKEEQIKELEEKLS